MAEFTNTRPPLGGPMQLARENHQAVLPLELPDDRARVPQSQIGPHPSALLPGHEWVYKTPAGAAYAGDARDLMTQLLAGGAKVDLVVTSPPYALEFQKRYGNVSKDEYVEWFRPFGRLIHDLLAPTGSLILNIGGSWNPGSPTRSLYHFKTLLMLCEEVGFHLAQELFWYNPAKLPAPAEWVNVRRIRVKDPVEYIWWLSTSEFPKSDNRNVLVEYSPDMLRILERGYRPKVRPSGHRITDKFRNHRGGAIPPNLLGRDPETLIQRGNNESNSTYIHRCREHGFEPHPARFPAALPEFFIRMLTDPGDLVMDPFAGSNTTGWVAELLGRRWLAFDIEPSYVAASAVRFEELR